MLCYAMLSLSFKFHWPPLLTALFLCRSHALPLFTSLLNVVSAYDPVGYGIPYNHLLFSDYREQLVEQAVQILIVTLEHDGGPSHCPSSPSSLEEHEVLRTKTAAVCLSGDDSLE